jgi:hypothetical protein
MVLNGKNINNYSILIIFLCNPMPFMFCWIVIVITYVFSCKNMFCAQGLNINLIPKVLYAFLSNIVL